MIEATPELTAYVIILVVALLVATILQARAAKANKNKESLLYSVVLVVISGVFFFYLLEINPNLESGVLKDVITPICVLIDLAVTVYLLPLIIKTDNSGGDDDGKSH